MKYTEVIEKFKAGALNSSISAYSGLENVSELSERWVSFLENNAQFFKEEQVHCLTVSGRTEVGGNHTDHQRGSVLAASLSLDTVACACVRSDMVAEVHSEGFEINPVDLCDLRVHPDEKETSEALIRGVAAAFVKRGYQIGGFKAAVGSKVLKGSGMSSSASFEVMIGLIFSELYNDGKISNEQLAVIAQEAENVYFGKPCGLMDQMACAVGGAVAIDFKDKDHPVIEKVEFDFTHSGYALALVDTGGSHADLSDEYGKMPSEMKQAAKLLGKEVLSEVSKEEFYEKLPELRGQISDRALLRSMHYFDETVRAKKEAEALKSGKMDEFLRLVKESGRSSYMYLQNVVLFSDPDHQPLALALALSEQLLKEDGAWRVHGGGLAGTIQAFVPNSKLDEYCTVMERVFGKGSCHVLSIRPMGAAKVC